MSSEVNHHFNLTDQDLVKLLNVGLNIRSRLVHVFEDGHLLLNNLNTLLAASVMLEYQLFLLFQDLLDYPLVVLTQLLNIVSILIACLLIRGHAVTQLLSPRLLGALLLLRPILSSLEELALVAAFLVLGLVAKLLLANRWSLAQASGFGGAWELQGGSWVSVLLAQEVATVVGAGCLHHGSKEDLLLSLSHGFSWVLLWPAGLLVLEALLEAIHLVLEALHQRLLASDLGRVVCLRRC